MSEADEMAPIQVIAPSAFSHGPIVSLRVGMGRRTLWQILNTSPRSSNWAISEDRKASTTHEVVDHGAQRHERPDDRPEGHVAELRCHLGELGEQRELGQGGLVADALEEGRLGALPRSASSR